MELPADMGACSAELRGGGGGEGGGGGGGGAHLW